MINERGFKLHFHQKRGRYLLFYTILMCGMLVGLQAQTDAFQISFLLEPGLNQAEVIIDQGETITLPAQRNIPRGEHTFTFLVDNLETSFVSTIETNQHFRVNREMNAFVSLGKGRSLITQRPVERYELQYGQMNKVLNFPGDQNFENIKLPYQKNQNLWLRAPGCRDEGLKITPFGYYVIRPTFSETKQFAGLMKTHIKKKALTRIGITTAATLLCAYWFQAGVDNRTEAYYQAYLDEINPKRVAEAYGKYHDEVNRVNKHQLQAASVGAVSFSAVVWSVIQLRVALNQVDVISKNFSETAAGDAGPEISELNVGVTWQF